MDVRLLGVRYNRFMEHCYFSQHHEIQAWNRAKTTVDPYRYLFEFLLTASDIKFLEEGCHIKL